MADNKIKGNLGEKIAEKCLLSKGLRILNKNFTTDIGEIDIVATDETTLIFVEVKLRASEKFGFAAEAVGYRKIRKISEVASQYIKKFRLFHVPVRFDVVEVYLQDSRVNHIENAFDSFLRY